MSPFERSLSQTSSGSTETEEDRRFNDRNRFLAQIQICQIDPPHSERLGTMRDLSRDGLYFVVRSYDYAIGTRLRLTMPHSKSEWTCEVVRTEKLPHGGQGVGVRILGFGN
jgi:hypothetical protein